MAGELRWNLLFEQSPLSIQVFAPDGRTSRFNRAWERLFGLSREEAYAFNVLGASDLIESGAIHGFARPSRARGWGRSS